MTKTIRRLAVTALGASLAVGMAVPALANHESPGAAPADDRFVEQPAPAPDDEFFDDGEFMDDGAGGGLLGGLGSEGGLLGGLLGGTEGGLLGGLLGGSEGGLLGGLLGGEGGGVVSRLPVVGQVTEGGLLSGLPLVGGNGGGLLSGLLDLESLTGGLAGRI